MRTLHPKALFDLVFDDLNGFIEAKRDDTEHDDACDHHIQLEYLRSVDDQIAQASPCRQKFSDDDAHQRKADIDLCRAQQNGNGAGKHHFAKGVPFFPAKGVDQRDLFGIHLSKARVKADDGAEERHGHAGDDDGSGAGSQPDDKQRRQSRLRQTVQDYQVRLRDLGEFSGVPEQRSRQNADENDQQKADDGLKERDADVCQKVVVLQLVDETGGNPAGAGKEKAVDPACRCGEFP